MAIFLCSSFRFEEDQLGRVCELNFRVIDVDELAEIDLVVMKERLRLKEIWLVYISISGRLTLN
jgi:hypothetical protein